MSEEASSARPDAGARALAKAFEVLETYDWGDDPNGLKAIDDAVLASEQNANARGELELRLIAALKKDSPRAARSFICRKLSRIGSPASVAALAEHPTDDELSHMARYALERIPGPEATTALREGLNSTTGRLRIGVINSLGVRRDAGSTTRLAALLDDPTPEVAEASASALGAIGSSEAARALVRFQEKAPASLQVAAADAVLVCAGRLRDAGREKEAHELYEALSSPDLPDHVRYAADCGVRGVSAGS